MVNDGSTFSMFVFFVSSLLCRSRGGEGPTLGVMGVGVWGLDDWGGEGRGERGGKEGDERGGKEGGEGW